VALNHVISARKKTVVFSVFDKKTSRTRLAIPIAIGIENKKPRTCFGMTVFKMSVTLGRQRLADGMAQYLAFSFKD
jgi:hypothetical protein